MEHPPVKTAKSPLVLPWKLMHEATASLGQGCGGGVALVLRGSDHAQLVLFILGLRAYRFP